MINLTIPCKIKLPEYYFFKKKINYIFEVTIKIQVHPLVITRPRLSPKNAQAFTSLQKWHILLQGLSHDRTLRELLLIEIMENTIFGIMILLHLWVF
jgi:hypothetical protein